jgi:hypothetical protein
MNPVPLREALDQIVFVFPNTLGEIARYSDVKGAVSLAGKDIDRWPFRHPQSLDSCALGVIPTEVGIHLPHEP